MIKRRSIPEDAIDWLWIELDYREGAMTVLEIAVEHGVPSGSILRRAKQEGWGCAGALRPAKRPRTNPYTESRREARLDAALELDVEQLILQPERPLGRTVELDDL